VIKILQNIKLKGGFNPNPPVAYALVAPDALFRSCARAPCMPLHKLRELLGHSGYARLYHFVRQDILPYSRGEEKRLSIVLILTLINASQQIKFLVKLLD